LLEKTLKKTPFFRASKVENDYTKKKGLLVTVDFLLFVMQSTGTAIIKEASKDKQG